MDTLKPGQILTTSAALVQVPAGLPIGTYHATLFVTSARGRSSVAVLTINVVDPKTLVAASAAPR
jgi:hypothetical protein